MPRVLEYGNDFMKATPISWLGYLVGYFWFFCAMRLGALWTLRSGAYPRMGPPVDAHHIQAAYNFLLRGFSVDLGIAVSLTAVWLIAQQSKRRIKGGQNAKVRH